MVSHSWLRGRNQGSYVAPVPSNANIHAGRTASVPANGGTAAPGTWRSGLGSTNRVGTTSASPQAALPTSRSGGDASGSWRRSLSGNLLPSDNAGAATRPGPSVTPASVNVVEAETAEPFRTYGEWLKTQQDAAASRLGYIPRSLAAEEADRQMEAGNGGGTLVVDPAQLYDPSNRSVSDCGTTRYPWSLVVTQRAMTAVDYTPSWNATSKSQSSYPWTIDLQDKGMEAIGYIRRDQAAKYAKGE